MMAKRPADKPARGAPAHDDEEPIDWLGSRPQATVETVRQLIEAENVLASYSHAIDLLAEAVQNALDALDARSEAEPDAPRKLAVHFDAKDRRFVVVDSGVGMSREELGMVLTPNVTLKQGGLARPRRGRSRGEKGVGLSFLVLASDVFKLRTCNGRERWDLSVKDAARWVRTEGSLPRPLAYPKRSTPDSMIGSDRYTAVSVAGIQGDQFDDDLFGKGPEELIWDLRTRTAIGNTAVLFETLGRAKPLPVEVSLHYRDSDGHKRDPVDVTYGYATPEDLLRLADPDAKILNFDDLSGLKAEEVERRGQGAAMRYVHRHNTASRGPVDLYLFTMDGNEMAGHLDSAREAGHWVPDEWQGMYVATRDMPTGVQLSAGVIQPRGYERRLFVLLQYDELKLDLGRKTLAGRTPAMLAGVVQAAWSEDLRFLVPRLGESVATGRALSTAALGARIRKARGLPDLDADLPYLKQPDKPRGVVALFHEMLARNGVVPPMRTLTSGVFRQSDALMFLPGADPGNDQPLHVLFALRPTELVEELEREERTGTVTLGVLWTLDDEELTASKIDVSDAEDGPDGATHELLLRGLARRQRLRVIVLDRLVHGA
jgi:hypothetical protein